MQTKTSPETTSGCCQKVRRKSTVADGTPQQGVAAGETAQSKTMSQIQTTKSTQPRAMQTTVRNTLAGDYFREQVKMCLPKHLTPERFIRMALTAIMRTPKLADCTEASVVKCMLTLSELGIEPDGRRAHLIPFENRKMGTVECTLIVDWKGIAELVMRSGLVGKLHADLICENDEFAYDLGDILHHRIDFKKSRGEPYAAYAMAVTKDGMKFVAVMTRDEIEKIRDNSQGWRAYKAGYAKQSPWADSPGEMWKKTAFRRLSKWLPLSPEIQDSLDKEEVPTTTASIVTLTPPAAELPQPSIQIDDDIPMDGPTNGALEPDPEPPKPETELPPKRATKPASAPKPGPLDNGEELNKMRQNANAAQEAAITEPSPNDPSKPAPGTSQAQLEAFVTENGYDWDTFARWGEGSGVVPDCSSMTGFGEISGPLASRILRSKGGLLGGLKNTKEAIGV